MHSKLADVQFYLQCVVFVLLNALKHAGVARSSGLDGIATGFVDSRSSAPWFRDFARPEELAFGARAAREDWQRASGSTEPPVVRARTWLLRTWLCHGPFDSDDTPGRRVNGEVH